MPKSIPAAALLAACITIVLAGCGPRTVSGAGALPAHLSIAAPLGLADVSEALYQPV